MSLDYGFVRDYNYRGFGFLQGLIHGHDVFFHIKKVKDYKIREALDARTGDHGYGTRFWYIVTHTPKGIEASQIWSNLKDVPSHNIETFASSMVIKCCDARILDKVQIEALKELLSNGYLSQQKLLEMVECRAFQNDLMLITIVKHLNSENKKRTAEILNLESKWLDVTQQLPIWVSDVTIEVFGEARLKDFERIRAKAEEEHQAEIHKRHKALLVKQTADQTKKQEHLLKKYKADPTGVRNEYFLRHICLNCGPLEGHVKRTRAGQGSRNLCLTCGTEWYVNHCWNCGGRVDERDPRTPKCNVCHWQKCTCTACKTMGCSTNPFSKEKTLDSPAFAGQSLEDILSDFGTSYTSEVCDWCDRTDITYRDEAYKLCEGCEEQLFGD